jgi:hypothetical protein
MKPIKLVYSAFQDMDIFLVHGNDLCGKLIRIGERENYAPGDDTTPTHAGFITSDRGQFFATEMNPELRESSLEEYVGSKVQMIELWRYQQWAPEKKNSAQDYLAYLRRKNQENSRYDLRGAIMSSPLGKRLFGWLPFMKNDSKRWFCSEEVCSIMKQFADDQMLPALCPDALGQYMRRRGNSIYKQAIGWKA